MEAPLHRFLVSCEMPLKYPLASRTIANWDIALCDWFADRTSSRQLPLILGLLVLGSATVMLNLGSSIAVLIVGRLLQGLSAAVVWVVGLALMADNVGRDE